MTEAAASTDWLTGGILIAYLLAMYALAVVAQKKAHSVEDFLVAGRRLPFFLSFSTLLATWFGAGTMLTAADEIRASGMQKAALEPIGAGLCLILAGLFFARPLWKMGLLTMSDLFRNKYGKTTEVVSALVMIPTYFGWIAVQFVALASLLQMVFGLDVSIGIFLVAVVGTGYTLAGGMWSVTLTDAVQVTLLLLGLLLLGYETLAVLGDGQIIQGFDRIGREVPPDMLHLVPRHNLAEFVDWMGLLVIAALGNIPSQDLLQRMFAAKSANTASRACVTAGVAYISFGLIPVLMGIASLIILPEEITGSVVPAMARAALHPWVAVVFTVTLASAVVSTIDSAILSPSSVLAQNVMCHLSKRDPLQLNRIAVLIIATISLVTAYAGESAYSLLEDAYAIGLVSLFAPFLMAMLHEPISQAPGLASILTGFVVWVVHFGAGWERFVEPLTADWSLAPPVAANCCILSFVAYGVAHFIERRRRQKPT